MTGVEIRGELLHLDHRKAVYWPRHDALIIADTHFGKSAIFRREGVPLPEGSDADDLAIIGSLVREYGGRRLYVLGDFVHGALPRGHRFYAGFNEWLEGFPELEVHVVLGNHDVHLCTEAIPGVHWHHRHALPPFELVHEPENAGEFYLAGHIHPVARLSTRADSLRMPIFWLREDGLVLPSFGALTGGYNIPSRRSEKRFGILPGSVVDLDLSHA